jgi:hypothetical protein
LSFQKVGSTLFFKPAFGQWFTCGFRRCVRRGK